jgi:hypothetical protein
MNASLLLLVALSAVGVPKDRSFPYYGATFTSFVADSMAKPDVFYKDMDRRLVGIDSKTWSQWIAKAKKMDALSAGAEAHRLLKKSITKFSLDRGFEFCNVVATGERQCLLQSVIISGLLQAAGFDAGTAMVWSNIEGQPSNLGHVACLLRLGNGRDIVVDASEPMPFPRHQGLFMRTNDGYRFLKPAYQADGSISAYQLTDGKRLLPKDVQPLTSAYLRSQFDYYRGERTPGSLIMRPSTAAGLAKSEFYLERAVRRCPDNPLALYMLARTLQAQKDQRGDRLFAQAKSLYDADGWLPESLR